MKVQDESSISRHKRATILTKTTKEDFLSLLGDADDKKNPIYMTGNNLDTSQSIIFNLPLIVTFFLLLFTLGPSLHTLCTAVIDLDEQTLSIIEGNPKKADVSIVFSISPKKLINGRHDHHSIVA